MKKGLILATFVAAQLLSVIVTQVIVIRNVGVGAETDSFIAAQTIAMVITAVLQAGLQSVWLSKLSAHSKREQSWRPTLEAAITQSLILATGTFFLFATTSALWIPMVFSAFDTQQIEQTKHLFIIFSISAALNTLSSQLTLALRAKEKFLASEGLNTFAVIASLPAIYFLARPDGLIFVAAITAIRSLVITLTQLKLLGWPSIHLQASERGANQWGQMRPVLIAASFYKTLPLVDRSLAALSPAGGLTVFNIAQTGVGAFSSILERSICVPITARFGHYVAEKRLDLLQQAYRRGIAKISVFAFLYLAGLLIIKAPFQHLMGEALRLPVSTSEDLWWMCLFLIGYLHVAASGTLPVAAIQALNDTKTPARIGILGFLFSLPIKAGAFSLLGIKGLVIASSMHYIMNMVLMTIHCERTIHDASSQPREA